MSPAVDAARCVRLRDGASLSSVLSESSETLSESRAADDARLVDRAGGARASFAAASEESDVDKDAARRPLTADRLCVATEVAFRNETSDRSSDDAESAEDDARDDGGVALGGARRRVLGGGGVGGINRCDG